MQKGTAALHEIVGGTDKQLKEELDQFDEVLQSIMENTDNLSRKNNVRRRGLRRIILSPAWNIYFQHVWGADRKSLPSGTFA